MQATEAQQLVRKQKYIGLKEAARLMGVHPNFLYKRVGKPNGPPAYKRGSVYRFPTYEFIMWAEQKVIP